MKSERKIQQLLTQLKNCERSGDHSKQVSIFRKLLKNLQEPTEINLLIDQIPPETMQTCLKNILESKEKDQKIIACLLWLIEVYAQKVNQIDDLLLNFLLQQMQSSDWFINYLASRALFTLCQNQGSRREDIRKKITENKIQINAGNRYFLQQIISPEILPSYNTQFIALSDTYARRDDILLGEPLTSSILSNIKYLYLRNPIILPRLPSKYATRLIGDVFTPLTQDENSLISNWMNQGGLLLIEIDEVDKPVSQFLKQFGITELRLSMRAFNPIFVWGSSTFVDPQLREKQFYYDPPTIVFATTGGERLLTLQNGSDTKIWFKPVGNGYLVVGALVSELFAALSYILFHIKAQDRLRTMMDQLRTELAQQKKIFIPDYANQNNITPGELKTLIDENISRGHLLAYIHEWFLIAYEKQ